MQQNLVSTETTEWLIYKEITNFYYVLIETMAQIYSVTFNGTAENQPETN